MKIIGLIPARGGSKGIPLKNITPLGGRPLIEYSIKSALAARTLDRVIVSTDSEKIAKVARKAGAEVPFLRPPGASDDTATALSVILHTLEFLESSENYRPDAVAYLQPTSPFRTAEHIEQALSILVEEDVETVVSVVRVPHNMLPLSLMQAEPSGFINFIATNRERKFRRQEKTEILYARNGPAILVSKCEVFFKGKLYGDKIFPLEMNNIHSLDIDTTEDISLGEYILPFLLKKNNIL